MDMTNSFANSYATLLELASTPLPFPLTQMARTFLFLWTFSIPFVLRGVVDESFIAMIFVFFLTYGFVGLELVAMKLMHPFGEVGSFDVRATIWFVCLSDPRYSFLCRRW
jgi:predicted membrane chloride channel (bestrophin family)